MALSYDLIDQIFSALKAINKSHNEIYFSIEDKFLVAYLLHNNCIALLLTDKKINFPLLNMGIKSASMKVKRMLNEQEKKQEQIPQNLQPQKIIEPATERDVALEKILDQLLTLLKLYLGPAAIFIFEDDVAKWKRTYVQSRENLPHLVEIIKKELDPKKEQADFLQQARVIIGGAS
ncbi:MAG: hypothetical protein KAG20_05965 [Cocleimonas sp.]|nr:hypothetical protein [Cocleimonas sp.]